MAFTVPRTWTDGELVTKAIMDPHIRDNFLAMGPHLIVRKPSDESLTSNITLQNDDHLLLAVGVSEVWKFKLSILYRSSTTADFKMAFTFPGGEIAAMGVTKGNTVSTAICVSFEGSSSPAAGSNNIDGLSAAQSSYFEIDGVYINGGSAGNLQFQWAQASSDATATKVMTNSSLWAVKLA